MLQSSQQHITLTGSAQVSGLQGVQSVQGASLAASEHSGSISGEHLGGSGDAYEPPSSPFDALFGKVGK